MRIIIGALFFCVAINAGGCSLGFTAYQLLKPEAELGYELTIAPGVDVKASARTDCTFECLSSFPNSPYTELGTLDRRKKYRPARTAKDFKLAVSKDVCSVGGDAVVVTQVNEDGLYMRGTVIRIAKKT